MSQHLDTYDMPDTGPEIGPVSGAVVRALCDVLASGVDIHRCLAAKALGHIGNQTATQPLIKALLDEDEDVRTDAAEALMALNDQEAADQLLENLIGDPCTEVKLSAMAALAGMKDPRVTPWLRRMLKGRDEEIIWDEEEFYASGWDDWVEVQIKSVAALAELNCADAVPEIIDAVCAEDAQDMSEAAFQAFAKMGLSGIGALAGFIEHGSSRFRRRAASVLASLDDPDAQEAIGLALADKSADVRLAALKARAAYASDDPALLPMLADSNSDVRARAAGLIGRHNRDVLMQLVQDPAPSVQVAALQAIGCCGDQVIDDEFITELAKRIDGKHQAIAIAALGAFANLAPQLAIEKLAEVLTNTSYAVPVRLGALKALGEMGGDFTIETLIGVMNDEARQIRLDAASTLARLASGPAVWPNPAGSALLAALSGVFDPEPQVCDAEGEVEEEPEASDAEEPEAEEDLLEDGLAEQFPSSTIEAILSDVPELASVTGLPEIGEDLSPEDMERLAIARQVLSKKKMRLNPEIAAHDDIRRFAARVLGDLDHGDVITGLAEALASDDSETRLAAADSLARIGARSIGFDEATTWALLAQIGTEERDLRLKLIRALAACDGEDVIAVLQADLTCDDAFIQVEAIRALAGKERPHSILVELLADRDPAVRLCAAEALAEDAGAEATERLAEFAASFEGYHTRAVARLLRGMDAERANRAFLKMLADAGNRRIWAVAIEALDEINTQTTNTLI